MYSTAHYLYLRGITSVCCCGYFKLCYVFAGNGTTDQTSEGMCAFYGCTVYHCLLRVANHWLLQPFIQACLAVPTHTCMMHVLMCNERYHSLQLNCSLNFLSFLFCAFKCLCLIAQKLCERQPSHLCSHVTCLTVEHPQGTYNMIALHLELNFAFSGLSHDCKSPPGRLWAMQSSLP